LRIDVASINLQVFDQIQKGQLEVKIGQGVLTSANGTRYETIKIT
jgi:hypothetical protein